MKRGINPGGVLSIINLYGYFKKERFDIIQYATPNASFYAAIAGKMASIKHRIYSQWGLVYLGCHGIKYRLLKSLEKLTCSCSTIIQPDSPEHLDICINKEKLFPRAKGYVIGNGSACGIDLSKFDYSKRELWKRTIRNKYGIPLDSFVIGYVGRVTRDKGINELFAAMKMLLSQDLSVFLIVVGPDEVQRGIDNDLYLWAKNSSQIIFTGFSNETEQFYSAMDICVLPSYREGFPTAPIEAQAMGVPVIVTDIPGPGDALIPNKTGYVIEARSSKALYEKCKYVFENKEKNKTMGESAHSFIVDKFEQNCLFDKIIIDRKHLMGIE